MLGWCACEPCGEDLVLPHVLLAVRVRALRCVLGDSKDAAVRDAAVTEVRASDAEMGTDGLKKTSMLVT